MTWCAHESHLILHDYSTGDQICTGCGTVLEAFAFSPGFDTIKDTRDAEESRISLDIPLDDRDRKKMKKLEDAVRCMGHDLKLTDALKDLAFRLIVDAVRAGYKVRESMVHQTAASALYYACKLDRVDRAEIELALNCNISSKQLTVSNKHFRRALASSPYADVLNAPANPIRLIPRFLDVLCRPPEAVVDPKEKYRVRRLSEDIGSIAAEKGVLEGKSPECCCITFIYKALKDLQYSSDILERVCQRCGLTPNTIGNALTILEQAL